MKARTHCRRGHPIRTADGQPIEANIYHTAKGISCRACTQEKSRVNQRRYRQEKAASEGREIKPHWRTNCCHGHPIRRLDGEPITGNVYLVPGGVTCRTCARKAAAQRGRQVRAAAAAAEGREIGPHNRDKTHCPQGHAYTPENIYWQRGRRVCRTCSLARQAHRKRHQYATPE